MKKIFYLTSFLLFCSCNNEDSKTVKSENDIDAARNFIQSALFGKYEEARTYMLPDSINDERMKLIERVKLSPDEKKGLAAASIIIHNRNVINDSTTIVIYSNSFKNDRDTLKVIKQKGEWLVDFNYLFEHESDSLSHPSLNKNDSINK